MADNKPRNAWEREFDKQMDQLLQRTGPARRDMIFGRQKDGSGGQPSNPFAPQRPHIEGGGAHTSVYGFDDEEGDESPTVVISTHELFQARNQQPPGGAPAQLQEEAAPSTQAWETGAEDIKALSGIDIKPLQVGPDGNFIEREAAPAKATGNQRHHRGHFAPPKANAHRGGEARAGAPQKRAGRAPQQSTPRAQNRAVGQNAVKGHPNPGAQAQGHARPNPRSTPKPKAAPERSAAAPGANSVQLLFPETKSNGGFYAILAAITVGIVAYLAFLS